MFVARIVSFCYLISLLFYNTLYYKLNCISRMTQSNYNEILTIFPVFRNVTFMKDNMGRHVCPRCGQAYKTKGTLVRHIKYECEKVSKFACHICKKRFRFNFTLSKHLLNVHSRESQLSIEIN